MSGEKSKNSGESGELVTSRLFDLIGWGTQIKGIDINCFKKDEHDCKKHGVDFLFHQINNLLSDVQDNILVSAKYRQKYPGSPTSELKKFLKDLANAMECFKFSDRNHLSLRPSIKQKSITGVIVWLAYDEDPDKGIIEEIDDFRNTEGLNYNQILLVDNKRANFIIETIDFAKKNSPNSKVEFLYQDTGLNMSSLHKKTSGNVLPVNFINSPILALKLVEEKNEILLLSFIDSYNKEFLKRIIGLSQNLTRGWANKIIIAFPDYHFLEHNQEVEEVKSLFNDLDFVRKLSIRSYKNDFKTLEEN